MTEPRPEASVVIPSWNGAELVEKTLDLLVKGEGVSFEVLVIDHGRLNRRTEEAMRRFDDLPWVRYIGEDEQLGFAGAVNHGVRLARSDFVAVICNDVLVDKHWLKELVQAYRAEREKGKSPVLFSLVDRGFLKDLRTVRTNFWFRGLLRQEAPPREDFFFPDGSSFFFDKSVYGEPFDSRYFLYQEDVYFGWRARLSGAEVRMVPASRADNFDGGTTKRTPYRTSYYSERNRWLNYFYFLSLPNLLRALPLLWADMLVKLLVGTNRRAKFHAWFWLAAHLPGIYRRRRELQATRRRGDAEILSLLSATYLDEPPGHPVNRIVRGVVRVLGLPLGP
jgi:GT2 family glycosyltransferase